MENDCGIINSRFRLILLVFYMVRPNVFGACRIVIFQRPQLWHISMSGVMLGRKAAGRKYLVVLYLIELQTLFFAK